MPYSQETLEYIKEYSDRIKRASEAVGVDPKAVAGVIANEDNHIREEYENPWHGIKEINLNYIGESLTSSHSHESIAEEYNDWQQNGRDPQPGLLEKTINPVANDLGRANINLYTAIDLLKQYNRDFPGDPLEMGSLDSSYDILVDRLKDPQDPISANLSALMVKRANDFFEKHTPTAWANMSDTDKNALAATYFKIGENRILENMKDNLKKDCVTVETDVEPYEVCKITGDLKTYTPNPKENEQALDDTLKAGDELTETAEEEGAVFDGSDVEYKMDKTAIVAFEGTESGVTSMVKAAIAMGEAATEQDRPHRHVSPADAVPSSGGLAAVCNCSAILAIPLIVFLILSGCIFRFPVPIIRHVGSGFAEIDDPMYAYPTKRCDEKMLAQRSAAIETSIRKSYPPGTDTNMLVNDLEEKEGRCKGGEGDSPVRCNYFFSSYTDLYIPPDHIKVDHYMINLEIADGKAIEDISVQIECRNEHYISGGFKAIDVPLRAFNDPWRNAGLLNDRATEVRNSILEYYPVGSDVDAFVQDLTAKKGFCGRTKERIVCTYLYSEIYSKVSSNGTKGDVKDNYVINLFITLLGEEGDDSDVKTIKDLEVVVVKYKSEIWKGGNG